MIRRTCSGVEETQIQKVLKGAQKKTHRRGYHFDVAEPACHACVLSKQDVQDGMSSAGNCQRFVYCSHVDSTKYVMSYDVTASARSVRKIERNCPLTKAPSILATSPKCEQRQWTSSGGEEIQIQKVLKGAQKVSLSRVSLR